MPMIPDDQLELLTAAVDGVLAPGEAQRLRELLDSSAEARDLFNRLKADADRLQKLPAVAPPPGLHARIMAALPMAVPAPAPVRARPSRIPTWLPLAVAASLLLCVTTASFLFFNAGQGENPGGVAAARRNPDRAAPRDSASTESGRTETPPPAAMPPAVPPTPPENTVAGAATPAPEAPAVAPAPTPGRSAVDAAPPFPPIPPLDLVQVRVPFLAPAADLEREDTRQRLVEEIGRDAAARVDLFVKDPVRGVELFQVAARASGLTLQVDAAAQERLKRKQGSAYLVYTEGLTPAEARDLFARVAAGEAKAPQRVFELLHVVPVRDADQKELRDVLGVDPGLGKRSPPEPKPISAGTGDMLTTTLTGKPAEKPAVLLTFNPPPLRTPPATSKELKQFLDRRGERRPGTVPLMIVIRQ